MHLQHTCIGWVYCSNSSYPVLKSHFPVLWKNCWFKTALLHMPNLQGPNCRHVISLMNLGTLFAPRSLLELHSMHPPTVTRQFGWNIRELGCAMGETLLRGKLAFVTRTGSFCASCQVKAMYCGLKPPCQIPPGPSPSCCSITCSWAWV